MSQPTAQRAGLSAKPFVKFKPPPSAATVVRCRGLNFIRHGSPLRARSAPNLSNALRYESADPPVGAPPRQPRARPRRTLCGLQLPQDEGLFRVHARSTLSIPLGVYTATNEAPSNQTEELRREGRSSRPVQPSAPPTRSGLVDRMRRTRRPFQYATYLNGGRRLASPIRCAQRWTEAHGSCPSSVSAGRRSWDPSSNKRSSCVRHPRSQEIDREEHTRLAREGR